ncbi:MAG: Ig-like domain-containing protein [Alphaproteobacteria bacterium]
MTIDVNSVNDAPSGTDVTLSTLEDTPLGFTAADFGFSDVNDAPNNFNSIFISSLPTNGILELSGVAVTAGQEIAVADIPNLFFTPALNDNGAGYDNFTFQVRDDGGTPNGGEDTDQTPNTVTIDVVSVNDAPEGTNNTVITNEDIPLTFTASDFGFTDTADTPANNFNSVIITTIPTTGTLELSGVAVTAGQEINVTDIPNLVFTPVLNESGVSYDSFTFQVRDDGGTANAGADLDLIPNTMTIDVTPVNDAPDSLDNTITILEDTLYGFNVGDFGFSDINDVPANNFQAVRISTLPTNGTIGLAAGASAPGLVSAGQVISLADIPFLTFTPDLNGNGIGYADFTFQVQDDGGTANGGVDFDTTPNTITFDVTPVNDAPFDLTLSSNFLPEGIGTWNIGTITGFDVDGPSLTYTIVSADPSFSITNGNILTNNGTKTFGVDPNTYSITLRVSDGSLTYDETFTITLIPEPVIIENNDPAEPFNRINTGTSSDASNISQPKLEFYIRDFMEEIRNGEIFRYGNQGLIDSSLSTSDVPMKDVFYGTDGNGIDEIIKRSIITRLQDLAANILEDTGAAVTPQQLAEIFGLDVLLYDIQDAEVLEEADDKSDDENIIYETNNIYKALVELNKESTDDVNSDEESKEDGIAEKSKQNQRQYLNRQLYQAALYYQSKNSALIEALSKQE